MADDLRPQLGFYGDPHVKTPHLDQFASTAVRCDRAYVQSAICSPSRNSMLSSLRPNTTGLRGFGVRIRDVRPDIVTLPQHFKQRGYHAAGFGKIFHIYDESMLGDENDPESWSQPLTWPTVPVWGPKQNALRNRLIAEARARGEVFNHPHDWPRAMTWDDSDVADEEMQDGQTAASAEAFLRARADKSEPFFLAVGFLRPHLPFNAPRRYWDLYDPDQLPLPEFRRKPIDAPEWSVNQGIVKNYYGMQALEELDDHFLRRYLQAYLASISYVDACFGRVMKALEESGHADDTIVIFMGDHGYQMGEYNSWGHKHSNFEISTRTPLMIRSPGIVSPGRGTKQLIEFLDLYPTVCELADVSIPAHVEGKSFAALLTDISASHRDAAGSEMRRGRRIGRSIRTNEFRFTQWRGANNQVLASELYDHRNDDLTGVLETRNVQGEPEMLSIQEELTARLHRLIPHD
ncbi:MAG: sulfatase [Planctomycetota bacterium]